MPTREEITDHHNQELKEKIKKELDKVKWPIDHGEVTARVRDGKLTLVTVDITFKYD